MKNRLVTGATIIFITFSTMAFSEDDHHKDSSSQISMKSSTHSKGMMSMNDMHKQMAKLKNTMDKIHGTEDIKERKIYLNLHMQEMHKGMSMMKGMMSSGIHENKNISKHNDVTDMKMMNEFHRKMEVRMDMMQAMLMQMMESMKEQQSMDLR